MASPFPGMDPYLEGEMWLEFTHTLANQVSRQLMPQLEPKYVALLARREVVESARPKPELVPYLAVEIRDIASRTLVTVIEILSPVNKRGKGAREYNEKRLEILETETHPSTSLRTSLLEIDLLRQGERIALVGELPRAPYFVFLSRWTRRPKTEIYPIQLRARLPVVPVPLLPPDPDVPLDLQAALDACFDLVGYERLLDYTQPLADLSAEESDWVVEIARK